MARKRITKKRDSLHMLIVEARFYDNISDELLRGATRVLDGAGAPPFDARRLILGCFSPIFAMGRE